MVKLSSENIVQTLKAANWCGRKISLHTWINIYYARPAKAIRKHLHTLYVIMFFQGLGEGSLSIS